MDTKYLRELAEEGAALHSEPTMPERQVCDGLLWALAERENLVTVVQNTESLLAHLLARGLPSTQYRMCERVLHQARELLGPNTHPKRGTPNVRAKQRPEHHDAARADGLGPSA